MRIRFVNGKEYEVIKKDGDLFVDTEKELVSISSFNFSEYTLIPK